jgi:two-component system OmpR family response regulator
LRFLVAESDLTLNQMIQKALNNNGYKTDEALSIADAKYYTNIRNYDLIIIDYSFGKKNISNFINEIRTNFTTTKIIVISDENDIQTEIDVLKIGADDYIKKPLHFELLIARIESKIRFGNFKQIQIKDLIISPNEEKIVFNSKVIELKGKPFEVFTHLAKHPNQIISKEQLLDAIWEEPELVTPNVIEVAINQIRQKIDKPLGITTVETVRRRGYKHHFQQVIF